MIGTAAYNGRFTFGATSWWRNGGSSPAETAVQTWKFTTPQEV